MFVQVLDLSKKVHRYVLWRENIDALRPDCIGSFQTILDDISPQGPGKAGRLSVLTSASNSQKEEFRFESQTGYSTHLRVGVMSHIFTREKLRLVPKQLVMQISPRISGRKSVFGMLVAFGLAVLLPSLRAQQNQSGSDSPQAAWSTIQQLVKDMETAVQSKKLHGIHDPTMKIRAPIKTLKQHSSMLSEDKGQKMTAALKQLDSAITDLHSAADAGNQQEAQTALKEVETALDQLKAQDPEAAFKSMH
jgi:hypothetical protein